MYSGDIIELDELESRVEAFESMRLSKGHADIADFLPDAQHPRYLEILVELVRVDMELSWDDGLRHNLNYYQRLMPDLASNADALEKVAFEEYRLRLQRGESASPEEYRHKYGISTSSWKLRDLSNLQKSATELTSLRRTLTSAWSNALKLADDVSEFPECNSDFLGFKLEEEIGHGAFARVYLARQGELADRNVVLKVAGGRSLEPQHLARLQHTNIVPIYSVHQVSGLTAVCMPYLGRRTLADFVKDLSRSEGLPKSGQAFVSTLNARTGSTIVGLDNKSKGSERISGKTSSDPCYAQIEQISQMSYGEAVTRIVLQIAEGLHHAHRRGIVHRDLKLANILLTDDGNPLILDFNLSEDVLVNGPTALAVGGTLPYMAPEHLDALIQGGAVDPRSDIFSLGVIFFELLCGKQPFPVRRGSLEVIVDQMIEDRKASPWNDLTDGMSPDIRSIINRCLEPRIEDRYQTVAELLEDMRRHLSNLPLHYAPNLSLVDRIKKWTRRHPRLSSAASVATISVVLLCVSGWLSLRLWANGVYNEFSMNLPTVRAALSIPENDIELIEDGLSSTLAALEMYGINEKAQWKIPLKYWVLDATKKSELNFALGELAYQMAEANQRLEKLQQSSSTLERAMNWNSLASVLFSGSEKPQALELQRSELLKARGGTEISNESQILESAIVSPRGSLDQMLMAQKLLSQRQFDGTMPLVTELRDLKPLDPVVWLLLGNTYAGQGSLERADECYSTAAALLPNSYWAAFQRGRCRMDMREFELAVDDFNSMVRIRKKLPSYVLLNRGLAHAALGNHAEAVADYTTALEQGATSTRIYFLRSRSYEQLGDRDSAAKDRDQGLQLTPLDEESWISRGIARLARDPEGALNDFREALKLNPRSISALQNVVHVTADVLNSDHEALESLNRILEIDSRNADALAGRAVLYGRHGNRVGALADVAALLQVSRQPVHLFQASCALSLTSASAGVDLPKAMRLLSMAIMQDPGLALRAKEDHDLAKLRDLPEFSKLLDFVAVTPQK